MKQNTNGYMVMTSPSITIKNSFIDKINRHDNFIHII